MEKCYGMLKESWMIFYKKPDIKKKNLKYVVVIPPNLRIHHHDPFNSRRILNVGNVPFKDIIKNRNGNKKELIGISKHIADWLWEWSES